MRILFLSLVLSLFSLKAFATDVLPWVIKVEENQGRVVFTACNIEGAVADDTLSHTAEEIENLNLINCQISGEQEGYTEEQLEQLKDNSIIKGVLRGLKKVGVAAALIGGAVLLVFTAPTSSLVAAVGGLILGLFQQGGTFAVLLGMTSAGGLIAAEATGQRMSDGQLKQQVYEGQFLTEQEVRDFEKQLRRLN